MHIKCKECEFCCFGAGPSEDSKSKNPSEKDKITTTDPPPAAQKLDVTKASTDAPLAAQRLTVTKEGILDGNTDDGKTVELGTPTPSSSRKGREALQLQGTNGASAIGQGPARQPDGGSGIQNSQDGGQKEANATGQQGSPQLPNGRNGQMDANLTGQQGTAPPSNGRNGQMDANATGQQGGAQQSYGGMAGGPQTNVEIPNVFRCRNPECQLVGEQDEVAEHEVECEYRTVPCPDGLCNAEVKFLELQSHIQTAHPKSVWECGNSNTLSRLWFLNSGKHYTVPNNNWILNLWTCKGKTFVARLRKMNGLWNSWVTVLGGVHEAAKYCSEIVTENPDGQADSALIYMGRVHSVDEREIDICMAGDCLVLTDTVVKNHTTPVRRIEMFQHGYDCRLGITYTVMGGGIY